MRKYHPPWRRLCSAEDLSLTEQERLAALMVLVPQSTRADNLRLGYRGRPVDLDGVGSVVVYAHFAPTYFVMTDRGEICMVI